MKLKTSQTHPTPILNGVSLALSIISFFLMSLWYIGWPVGLLSVLLASRAKRLSGSPIATTGIVLGILAFVGTSLIYSIASLTIWLETLDFYFPLPHLF